MSGSKFLAVWIMGAFASAALIAAYFLETGRRERQCFRKCPLETLGRDFEGPNSYVVVHYCARHDFHHVEDVPEAVWLELRKAGVPELRR